METYQKPKITDTYMQASAIIENAPGVIQESYQLKLVGGSSNCGGASNSSSHSSNSGHSASRVSGPNLDKKL